jgi:hypothetical protein
MKENEARGINLFGINLHFRDPCDILPLCMHNNLYLKINYTARG